jgi:hypothetical protein
VIKSFTSLNDSSLGFRIFPRGIPHIDFATILVSNSIAE